jgi:hypothetical protein
MRSHIIAVINPNNADKNSVQDIIAAIKDCGGFDIVDLGSGMIEAVVPSISLCEIHFMDGVGCVRTVMNYQEK